MNMIIGFLFHLGEKRHTIIWLDSVPTLHTKMQNHIGFAINYKLIFLAPRSDANSELTFILAFLKYYSLILGE